MEASSVAHDPPGASAVEFALVLPVLVLLLFGIIEFGLAFYRAQGLEAAAREGGRVAAIGANGGTIETAVESGLGAVPISREHVVVCVSDVADVSDPVGDGPCADPEQFSGCEAPNVRVVVRLDATVVAAGTYALNIPLGPGTTPDYRAEAVFRCEVHEDA